MKMTKRVKQERSVSKVGRLFQQGMRYIVILVLAMVCSACAASMQTKASENLNKLSPLLTVAIHPVAPNFTLQSLDGEEISLDQYKGKYLLINFWATWCGPCLSEMDNLHETYEKFRQSNFEIISLSFDQTPDVVRNFRRERWQMPWLHAFIESGFNAPISRVFEVTGIPKPILVDPNGKIIALGADLRGRNLERTLSNVLSDITASNQ